MQKLSRTEKNGTIAALQTECIPKKIEWSSYCFTFACVEPTGLNFTWLFLDGNSKSDLHLNVFLSVTLVPHFVITGTAADRDNLAGGGGVPGGGTKESLTWWQWQFPVLLLSDCGFMNPLSQDHNDSRRLLVSGLEFRSQDSDKSKTKHRHSFLYWSSCAIEGNRKE